MTSAPGDPPGSRVTMARNFAALRRSAKVLIWVDFPLPSPPSKVMNRPRPGVLLTAASAISELLGTGAKHPDDEFAGTIDRPPHRQSLANRLGGINRRLDGNVGAAPNLDQADLLAGLDRRAYRPIIDNARDQFVGAVFLNHHLDRLRTGKLDRTAVATEYLGVADRLLRRKQGPFLEIAKSPFEHFPGLVRPVFGILETVDDDDQPNAVLHSGADHAVAALLGIAGLQPVGPLERGGQQRVAIRLPDLVPGEFAFAE